MGNSKGCLEPSHSRRRCHSRPAGHRQKDYRVAQRADGPRSREIRGGAPVAQSRRHRSGGHRAGLRHHAAHAERSIADSAQRIREDTHRPGFYRRSQESQFGHQSALRQRSEENRRRPVQAHAGNAYQTGHHPHAQVSPKLLQRRSIEC